MIRSFRDRLPSLFIAATLAGAVGLWACADDGVSPSAPDAPVQHDDGADFVSDDGAPPGFTPNGVPYRNPDYEHATGRSGEAELTARALMNMDGTTDLEVTTGELDGPPPPHEMTKLQIKYLDETDDVAWVDNQNRLQTGYIHSVYDGLTRHNHLQVQGNVTVPNASGRGTRTGVVTIQERINLRPDLAALSVYGPAEAASGTFVSFAATLGEINGDVGADADCVYYVDGDEMARSVGIWIAEGDVVSCVMSHVFEEGGVRTVTVAVEGVTPGDWDTSNNATSTTIEIFHQLEGVASASENHYTRDVAYFGSTIRRQTDDDRHWTEASFYGSTPNELVFPADFSVTQSTGGTVLEQTDVQGLGSSGNPCATHVTSRSATLVCSEDGTTSVTINHTSGWATYFTRNQSLDYWRHCHRTWWGDCNYHRHYFWRTDFYYSNSESWGTGTVQPLADDYTFDVRLSDAEGIRFESGEVSIPLTSYSSTTPIAWGGTIREWGKSGSTTFGGGS